MLLPFFLPFRAVTNHGPKANPFPRRGYLVRYKTDRRLPLLCVPCRGTPFKKNGTFRNRGRVQNVARHTWEERFHFICRSSMQPTIRAGRSHLPCGTIGRARLAEKMGGTGLGMQTRIKRHRIGEVSSKYGYNPGQVDQDLEARKARSTKTRRRIRYLHIYNR